MADLMIKGLTPNVVGTAPAAPVTEGKESKDAMTVFASMMCRTDGSASQTDGLFTVAKANIKTAETITPDTFKSKVVKEQPQQTGKDISPEMQDKLQEINNKIKEAVMEEYDITEEELEEAMQVLGLEYIELLLPENLVKLSVEITGAADSLALLSNNGFNQLYGLMQDLTAEITSELDIQITPETVETFAEIINPTELPDTQVSEAVVPAMEMTDEETAEVSADDLEIRDGSADISVASNDASEANEELADQVQDLVENGIEKGTVEVVKTTETVKDESGKPAAEVETDNEEPMESVIRVASDVEETTEQDQNLSQNDGEKKETFTGSGSTRTTARETKTETNNTNTNNVANFDNFRNIAPEAPIEAPQPLSQADTFNIIRQISDYMRINISGPETSLEMQLNPENLGKVGINLSVRDGAVTAQIAVENATVKQALESQMVILRENMNNQGLKVEAVEVTIASHEFEQNLENGAPAGQQQEQQQGGQAERTTRSITASDLTSIDEMPEEEALAAKIMAENGNSMDITA